MKFTVSKDNLVAALRRVMTAVSPRSTLPALNNLLFETEGENLRITATDLEVCVTTSIPALIESSGATTLPAKKFNQICSGLPVGDVTLDCGEDDMATLTCGKVRYRIHGLSAEQYPKPEDFSEDWSFSLSARDLVSSLEKVAYARSDDDSRKQLSGVLLSIRAGMFTIAATDGRRLALVERVLDSEGAVDGDVILPNKAVLELVKNMNQDGDIKVRLSTANVAFETQDTSVMSKLVEGSYPNFRQVIPDRFASSVAISRLPFADALNRVSMVVSENSSSVKLNFGATQLTLSASSVEYGEASEPVDVSYEGEEINIAFNPVYFSDPLKFLDCDQLIIQFNDELSPVQLSGDEGFLYILMPMRN
jgi:DNA polymerase-3 subunit beta